MSETSVGQPTAHTIVGEYEPGHNSELFRVSNPMHLLEMLTGISKPVEAPASTGFEVNLQLDQILAAASSIAKEQGTWSQDEYDRRRVFTP